MFTHVARMQLKSACSVQCPGYIQALINTNELDSEMNHISNVILHEIERRC